MNNLTLLIKELEEKKSLLINMKIDWKYPHKLISTFITLRKILLKKRKEKRNYFLRQEKEELCVENSSNVVF